ncbi:MAG: serine/threonine-protein kinase, partial [Rhodococcus sp. (in: high G+C Gram-positive bacteria)]
MADRTGSPTTDRRRLFADRYALGAVLGRGGMADVYRAEDVLLGRAVAVKIFRPTEPIVTDTRRIESEIRTLASLTHPGLVTLFDAGTALDAPAGTDPNAECMIAPYLVMELVDGPTLNTFRSGAALSPSVVARIGVELAEALAYIHSVGVVHRDIKPANILLTGTPDGRGRSTKLTDFGIARVLDADPLTEHGTAVGTAHYLSPEQATGTATGPPADVYSLGLVLIECLSGRMVFEGSAIAAAVARLHHDPSVPPDLGSDWVSLLSGMTARSPQDRPAADQVAIALRSLAESDFPTSVAS